MRIEIPVITRCGAPVKISKDGAYVENRRGESVWEYKGCEVTGKGIYVAACARSGTIYMTRVLEKLGYRIGHEKTDVDGSVGYHLAIIKPDNCFHQVRHPLKQISSMFDHQAWGFMNHVIECHGRGLLGCMQYWLKWNELLEEFCIWRYRLEDIANVWPEFLERIDHSFETLPDIKERNSRETNLSCSCKKLTTFTWEQLSACNRELARKIYDKHLEYGYSPARDREESLQSSGQPQGA